MPIIVLILYVVWVFSIAKIEYYLFANRTINANTALVHKKLTLSRLPVLILMCMVMAGGNTTLQPVISGGNATTLLGFLSLILMFPFLHDGILYQTYCNKTAKRSYPDGFFSNPSGKSTAKINFTFFVRFCIFAIGIGSYIVFSTLIYFF